MNARSTNTIFVAPLILHLTCLLAAAQPLRLISPGRCSTRRVSRSRRVIRLIRLNSQELSLTRLAR